MMANMEAHPNLTDDEHSLLVGKNNPMISDNEEEEIEPTSKQSGFAARFLNRYFFLSVFAWLNYLLGVLNILFNAMIYMDIYSPQFFETFEQQCREQLPMAVFLDNFLTIATVLFFSYVLRYLRQVG